MKWRGLIVISQTAFLTCISVVLTALKFQLVEAMFIHPNIGLYIDANSTPLKP